LIEPRRRAVLFDLDGTLVDSAPDLVGTLNDLRLAQGLAPKPYAALRSQASKGAAGLLAAGLPELDEHERAALRDSFVARYRQRLWQDSRAFEGMDEVLRTLAASGLRLAIVTNKIESLARPLVKQAGWHHLFGSLVGGDSTPAPKPDPGPVLAACRALDVAPDACVMVGDDERDVLAGRAAGTATWAARWGYIDDSDSPERWGADRVIDRVEELSELIGNPVKQ
jgi:phosphoglycolate phosphatase